MNALASPILAPALPAALAGGAARGACVFWLQPRAMSYLGLNLLFNLAVPIALATIAQMLIITVNDLDLSIGSFVSFVACVTATWLNDPALGVPHPGGVHRRLCGLGALIHLRNLPSIVVTLGMSFVWLGSRCCCCRRPAAAPDWLRAIMTVQAAARADGDPREHRDRARVHSS
jgi:ribose transport system permease protein